ncbi:MAG: tRNA (guanosine(37)-N1)-methyltransferase TrmD [Sphaerochaetaceae bacterium]|nr:tRNA (guanosine(37)-N1)-methyltransferase TrmD [Spirochaetales bacterium]MDY5968044.1 tRNA (guanosine(37)-N1)-methyltransferase TrmD [Sphaerochaetaceae bacterium]
MKITILTLFPEVFEGFFSTSIPLLAKEKGLLDVNIINFRDYTTDKHHKCDDEPYGGGAGMVLKPEPLFKALKSIDATSKRVIYPTPSGKLFNQSIAKELSNEKELVFIAGHYEGLDQRVIDSFVTDELSIGDYVLSSGETAILVMVDAIYRLIDGVISPESLVEESFNDSLLEYPQYTRPQEYEGMRVPEVLLSGNHKQINDWRYKKRLEKTIKNRIDLMSKNIN